MAIVAIETLRLDEFPNLLWLILEDEDGSKGLGETFFGPQAVEAYIHETAAPLVLGQAGDPEPIRLKLRPYVGHQAAGAEVRGASAIDIALWDLWGKRTGQRFGSCSVDGHETPFAHTIPAPAIDMSARIRARLHKIGDWGNPRGLMRISMGS